jgi:hypothetical protein
LHRVDDHVDHHLLQPFGIDEEERDDGDNLGQ